jgi:endonuclease/exonuclease/phosphatase family metal-dependent hydrolase
MERAAMTSGIVGFRRGAMALLATIAVFACAPRARAEDPHTLRVMTQNLFIGTFYRELMAARTPQEFASAVTLTYQHIQATKPAERMAAIAREIAKAEPDLIGVQQAAIVRTGSKPPATTVELDYVKILLAELAKSGRHYKVVAVVPGLDAEAPNSLGFFVRLTTRDVLLARRDDDARLDNLQIRQFLGAAIFPTPAGVLTDPSGFAAIDVTVRGQSLRFVTTHLDVTPTVSFFQALELVQATSDTSMPTVLVCDCNATPDVPSDPSFASYRLLRDAGFIDAFRLARPDQPGLTCCQAEDLRNQASAVSRRIDLVQFRGPFRVMHADVVGASPGDRTPSRLWPSDHAGVIVTLRLGGARQDARN